MSEHLRQFFHRSRHLMGAVFTRSSSAGTFKHTEHGSKPDSTVHGESARRQDSSEMDAFIKRVLHRLDSIEQKIDQLLMPVDVIKH